MNSDDNEYAVALLKSWFMSHHEFFNSFGGKLEYKDSGHGSANVVLETKEHFVDISAWNHASCLDIQVLNIHSEESSFPHVGDCESIEVFESYLTNLIAWLKNEKNCT